MSFPVTVQFRGIDASGALRAKIDEHARHLGRLADDIRSCRVVVEAERRPQHAGDLYGVHIHLVVGAREIDAGDVHAQEPRHEDPYAAVADAFNVARRCVEDYVHRRRRAARAKRDTARSA